MCQIYVELNEEKIYLIEFKSKTVKRNDFRHTMRKELNEIPNEWIYWTEINFKIRKEKTWKDYTNHWIIIKWWQREW